MLVEKVYRFFSTFGFQQMPGFLIALFVELCLATEP